MNVASAVPATITHGPNSISHIGSWPNAHTPRVLPGVHDWVGVKAMMPSTVAKHATENRPTMPTMVRKIRMSRRLVRVPSIGMGNAIIRAATPSDAREVAELLAELGYPNNPVETVAARIERWHEGVVLVADEDGVVRGVLALTSFPTFEVEGRLGRIVALVVSEQCRGGGVGRRLVAAAEDAARAAGCFGVEVSSSRRRIGAHAFYQALGYVDRCAAQGKFYKEFASTG